MTSFHPRSGVKDFEQNNSAEISKETLLTKQLVYVVCTQRVIKLFEDAIETSRFSQENI